MRFLLDIIIHSASNQRHSLYTACKILNDDEMRVLPVVDTYTITEVARLSNRGWPSEVDSPAETEKKTQPGFFFLHPFWLWSLA